MVVQSGSFVSHYVNKINIERKVYTVGTTNDYKIK